MSSNLANAWAAIKTAIEALDPETDIPDGSGKSFTFIDTTGEEHGGGAHRTCIWDDVVEAPKVIDSATGQTQWKTALRVFWHADMGIGDRRSQHDFMVAAQAEMQYLRRTVDGISPGHPVQAIIIKRSRLRKPSANRGEEPRGTGRLPFGEVYEAVIDLDVDVVETT